eukprot:772288-Alexandrium_andersonii.AAC.1
MPSCASLARRSAGAPRWAQTCSIASPSMAAGSRAAKANKARGRARAAALPSSPGPRWGISWTMRRVQLWP